MIHILQFGLPILLIIVLSFILTVLIYAIKKQHETVKHKTQ
ncbi:Uncharacterised protein [Actinobacillus delphinicola]|uniref:Uncharacterized protein n=1 Tax=Actinobacillus delphinicola TaxID=51161 RepID=A0A448TTP8_9PAST|nr:Uncharacterised protein [Actinobacillus delphinicola]